MKKFLVAGVLGAAMAFPAAAAVTLTFEALFTEAYRMMPCPIGDNCLTLVEEVRIPLTTSITFEFGGSGFLPPTKNVYEEHLIHPRTGRPVGLYTAHQLFALDTPVRTAFELPGLLPAELSVPNPITPELWHAPPVWFSQFIDSRYASTTQGFNRFDDTGQVGFASSDWTVSAGQTATVSKGQLNTSVSHSMGLTLQGIGLFDVTPDNFDDWRTEAEFVELVKESLGCGFCLSIGSSNSLYDGFAGTSSHVAHFGSARLLSVDVVTAVPEPGTWMLALIGLGAVAVAAQRRRRPATA